jgi:ferrous iron transport protein B
MASASRKPSPDLPRLDGADDSDADPGAGQRALAGAEAAGVRSGGGARQSDRRHWTLAECDCRHRIAERTGEDADLHIADTRFGHAHTLAQRVVRDEPPGRAPPVSDRIDRVVLNRLFGIPLFLLMMYLMFMFTMNIGGAFIDFFDQAGQALFVDGLGALLNAIWARQTG